MGNKNSQQIINNLQVNMSKNALAKDETDPKVLREHAILNAIIQRFPSDKDLNSVQMRAVLKIQRQARRRNAWTVAQQENQWKIFSDLDTRDEADMLGLAIFMQTLLDAVPSTDSFVTSLQIDDEDESESGSINMDSIRITGAHDIPLGKSQDFDLPKGDITISNAMDIVELYKTGGRLSIKSVQKILRVTYKSLKLLKNITRVHIDNNSKVNIVGDIHGQLGDLFHILDEAGEPGPQNKYIFNGDFVDRGTNGVEVICALLALHAALPDCVILNRGNHEDHAICCVYGFQRECKEKYDELTFGMFAEVFRYLPLFTIVNESLFVIHGGLFHDRNVLLSDLEEIDRSDYMPKPQVPYPQCAVGLDEDGQRKEFLKQLQRDALWSDPEDRNGLGRSVRGAGVHFGPDITKEFLDNNRLSMIVRSHECVRKGFELPFTGPHEHLLGTIFSASNYSGGDNEGAYMVFSTHMMAGATPVKNSNLFYYIRTFKTSEAEASLVSANMQSLQGLILKKRSALHQAFLAADTENTGTLSKSIWAEVMTRVTQVQIRWLTTLPIIAPDDCVKGNNVLYTSFLQSFSSHLNDQAGNLMDAMYAQRTKLEAIFHYFDRDGNGTISRSEFHQGCNLLNTTLPPDQQLTDYDHILDLMDFDQSDSIDINEFFEVFRILDAQDGQVDGIISMANKHTK